jgi:hypothetical protein
MDTGMISEYLEIDVVSIGCGDVGASDAVSVLFVHPAMLMTTAIDIAAFLSIFIVRCV